MTSILKWAKSSGHQGALSDLVCSPDFLRTILDGMSSGVMVTDKHGNLLLVNHSGAECFGIKDPSAILGCPVEDIIPGAGPLLHPTPSEIQRQLKLRRSEGENRVIGYTTMLMSPDSYRVIVFRDLTLLLKAESRRQRAEQMAEVGEMVAKLSHEIKNPLAAVLAGLQFLERDTQLTDNVHHVLHQILGEVKKLSSVIEDLLRASRPKSIFPLPTSLVGALEEILHPHLLHSRNRGITISYQLPEKDVTILLDQILFARVLDNVVLNALDVLERDGQIDIKCQSLSADERERLFPGWTAAVVSIRVTDTGPGIAEDDLQKIFDPYFTTKKTGTGLGLTIAKEIIHAHGGVLAFCSRVGQGTTFEIFLPVCQHHHGPCYMNKSANGCANACETCAVKGTSTGFCCWAIAGQASFAETGEWPASCQGCSFFLTHNLQSFFDAEKYCS